MRSRAFWITVGALAIIFLMVAGAYAQSAMSKVHGYVKVNGNYTNGVDVSLSNQASGSAVTADSNGHRGYYEFTVNNGSQIIITARSGSFYASYNYYVNAPDVSVPDIDISTATPTPSPTPVATPTPVPWPSGVLGGKVIRNDSSSFVPVSARNPSVMPTPMSTLAPTAAPAASPTPTPTAVPSASPFANIYLWLIIAIIGIIAIAAIAIAILMYVKK